MIVYLWVDDEMRPTFLMIDLYFRERYEPQVQAINSLVQIYTILF